MQSLLTTGGGLLFAGDAAGRFRALDQETAEVLWEMNLGSPVTGYPVDVRGRRAPVRRGLDRVLARRQLHPRADPRPPEHAVRVRAARGRDRPAGAAARAGQPGRRGRSRSTRRRSAAPRARSPTACSAPRRRARARRSTRASCAACHGADFEPAQGTPPLTGRGVPRQLARPHARRPATPRSARCRPARRTRCPPPTTSR